MPRPDELDYSKDKRRDKSWKGGLGGTPRQVMPFGAEVTGFHTDLEIAFHFLPLPLQ